MNAKPQLEIGDRKEGGMESNRAREIQNLILESITDGFFFLDRQLRFVWLNRAGARLLGVKPEEPVGRSVLEILSHDPDNKFSTELNRAIETGQADHFEVFYPAPVKRWFEAHCYPSQEGLAVYFLDITGRRLAEEARAESEKRFRDAVEATSDGIWGWDVSTGDGYFSPNYAKILGYEPGELNAKVDTWVELMHPEDREPTLAANMACIRNETPEVRVEFRMLARDGTWRWILGRGKVVRRDDSGRTLELMGTQVDITERKRMEDELRKARDELELRVQQRTKELGLKTRRLEKVNAALKILLEQREEDKRHLQESVLASVKSLIFPYVEKLKNTRLDSDQMTYFSILESHIREITSPFARILSEKYLGLTPMEVRTAGLIRDGKTTQEIAAILCISENTVSFHRFNIRKKLKLANKKVNLRTYLQTFDK